MEATQAKPAGDEEFLGHLYKGGELLGEGKVIEAKDHLEQAYRLKPDDEKGKNLLGLTYFKLGLFERAAEIYESLVHENPADPTLRVNLGLVYLKTNALMRAIREFETSVDLAPEHKKAHNYLGLALAQAGEYGRAREHFLEAGSDLMAEKMARAIAGEVQAPAPPAEPVASQAIEQSFAAAVEELPPQDSASEEGVVVMAEEAALPPFDAAAVETPVEPPPEESFALMSDESVSPYPAEFSEEQVPPQPEAQYAAEYAQVEAASTQEPAAEQISEPYAAEPVAGAEEQVSYPEPVAEEQAAISEELPASAAYSDSYSPEQAGAVAPPEPERQYSDEFDEPVTAVRELTPEATLPGSSLLESSFSNRDFSSEEVTVPGFVAPKKMLENDEEMRFAEDEGPSAPVIELQPEEASQEEVTPPEGVEFSQFGPGGEASGEAEPAPVEPAEVTRDEAPAQEASWAGAEDPMAAAMEAAGVSEPSPSAPLVETAPHESGQEAAEASSGTAPRLLELAPSLPLAPTAGQAFEIGPEVVVLHVHGELFARLSSFVGMEGTVNFEPLKRKFRGRISDQAFGEGTEQMQKLTGNGSVLVSAPGFGYHAVDLDDESAYFRESAVFAFEERVSFENGRMGGEELAEVLLVHLRGQGKVLLRVGQGGLRSLTIRANRPVTLPATGLVGWYGAVNPRLVSLPVAGPGAAGGTGVELSGEGFALVLVPGS